MDKGTTLWYVEGVAICDPDFPYPVDFGFHRILEEAIEFWLSQNA